MPKVSTNISIDTETKVKAQELLSELGLDMSTAVNIFLKQMIYEGGIPFAITREIPNEETKRAIDSVRLGKNLSREFHTVSELMEDLYADDSV